MVTRATSAVIVDPVFARQQLPGATLVKGDSVEALAKGIAAVIAMEMEREMGDGPFAMHSFVPDREAYRSLVGRTRPLGEAVLALLRRRPSETAPTLLQLAVVARTSVLVSYARPRPLAHGGFDLAPWPAGVAPVAEDRAAPSRAYGKLEEGLAWLGTAPAAGERVVDLGGSPGGWAWKALQRGASVIAVDRSPLAAPASGHPGLTFVRANAFVYEPPAPVDWLFCDVICEPPRTIELVERWMARGWCRRVVATVKFKGKGGYEILRDAHERLRWPFVRVKHLFRHHNEVALLARRD